MPVVTVKRRYNRCKPELYFKYNEESDIHAEIIPDVNPAEVFGETLSGTNPNPSIVILRDPLVAKLVVEGARILTSLGTSLLSDTMNSEFCDDTEM